MQKRKRGFALMDPDKLKKITSLGGKMAHKSSNAHEFTKEEARVAGKKGGAIQKRKALIKKLKNLGKALNKWNRI